MSTDGILQPRKENHEDRRVRLLVPPSWQRVNGGLRIVVIPRRAGRRARRTRRRIRSRFHRRLTSRASLRARTHQQRLSGRRVLAWDRRPLTTGFQFHYGPRRTTTTRTEVAKVHAPAGPGSDRLRLLPDAPRYATPLHRLPQPDAPRFAPPAALQTGLAAPETGPDDAPGQCDLAGQVMSTNLFGAQSQTLDTKGLGNGSPENDGMAVRIPAKQQGIMQVHFINAGTKPILREAWANVLYVDKSQVTQVGDPIFFIAGYTMDVKLGETTVIHGTAKVPAGAESGFRLIAATPHYHAHVAFHGHRDHRWRDANDPRQLPDDARSARAAAHRVQQHDEERAPQRGGARSMVPRAAYSTCRRVITSTGTARSPTTTSPTRSRSRTPSTPARCATCSASTAPPSAGPGRRRTSRSLAAGAGRIQAAGTAGTHAVGSLSGLAYIEFPPFDQDWPPERCLCSQRLKSSESVP